MHPRGAFVFLRTTSHSRRLPAARFVREHTRNVPAEFPERIVLTGFMGSGKSTVGRRLAERLGWTFTDLDAEIEQRAGLSVPAIFARDGEARFRELESEALEHLFARDQIVIALGGGAPETALNRDRLSASRRTAVVYLEAPFATLLARCDAQARDANATARPNLADRARAEQRFEQRQPLYREIATHTLDTSVLPPEEAAEAILRLLAS